LTAIKEYFYILLYYGKCFILKHEKNRKFSTLSGVIK